MKQQQNETEREKRMTEQEAMKDNIDLVITWFEHIAQLSDDRKTLTGEVMTRQHTLDEINRLARQSAEYVRKYML